MVGGSVFPTFLRLLFGKLASREIVEFFKGEKVSDALLTKLGTAIKCVNGVLDDAEKKQITNSAVRKWLDNLKDAFYEADELLDEISNRAPRSKLGGGGIRARNEQVRNSSTSSKTGIEAKLEEILDRLEDLIKREDSLGSENVFVENPSLQKVSTTSVVDESCVYGRDGDLETVLKLLFSDDASGNDVGVISVVGMGGVGKTTLAQLVYNDRRVIERFDLRAWVCISEEFDVFKLTAEVLREVSQARCYGKTPNQLQVELKERLTKKKFLLVLDDAWNDKPDYWDILLRPLKAGARGSKIVVTTRNHTVASSIHTDQTHHLGRLTDDACWLLFAKHALDGRSVHPDLELVGRELVRRCKGLPLAVKTLAGLLRSKREVMEWERIAKSDIWVMFEDSLLPVLGLSYQHLPSHLKRCFAYCAIFPKDYVFEKEELILLWSAEGFLVQPKGNKEMVDIGDEYFHDLVSRSFFQPSSVYSSCFIMHDLINDLAKFVAGEFCFRLEGSDLSKINGKPRHLSYSRADDSLKKLLPEAGLLRTFLPLEGFRRWRADNRIDGQVTLNLLPSLRRLRVLSLSDYDNVVGLPHSIGYLKHLRYLDVSRTNIERLPETVCNLYLLETLLLRGCNSLVVLPDSISNLIHLQHLDLSETSVRLLPDSVTSLDNLQTLILYGCKDLTGLPLNLSRMTNLHHLDLRKTKLQEMPPQLGKLRKLKKLTDVVLGEQSGSWIKELGKLQDLQGELCIRNLQNVVNTEDASQSNVKAKKHLRELELTWDCGVDNSFHEGVLEQLRPHANLERLFIVGYGGVRFPEWIGETSFSHMVFIKLSGCKHCSFLPPLGHLASLRELSLIGFDGVMTVGAEFYGSTTSLNKPFQSLKILRFERMPQWREWVSLVDDNEGGAFQLLQELYIVECPQLEKGVPIHLPSLTVLEVQGCPQLAASLPMAQTILRMMLRDDARDVLMLQLPSGLQGLMVGKLPSFDSLLGRMKPVDRFCSSLEAIELVNCSSLSCFPLELFHRLKSLRLGRCPSLESLSAPGEAQRDFISLNSLEITRCKNFISFPEGGLSAPNLAKLQLRGCSRLKSLPEHMHFLLPSLMSLEIGNCPEVESFPEGGLPDKLESLEIKQCDKLIAGRMHWNLQMLPSLSCFKIFMNEDVECFPEETLLPQSLTSLSIRSLSNLICLCHKGLQHLTVLRELVIWSCPKLESLPEEGVPTSLSILSIYNCPSLEQRCEREKGQDWSKISHIPNIQIE